MKRIIRVLYIGPVEVRFQVSKHGLCISGSLRIIKIFQTSKLDCIVLKSCHCEVLGAIAYQCKSTGKIFMDFLFFNIFLRNFNRRLIILIVISIRIDKMMVDCKDAAMIHQCDSMSRFHDL